MSPRARERRRDCRACRWYTPARTTGLGLCAAPIPPWAAQVAGRRCFVKADAEALECPAYRRAR